VEAVVCMLICKFRFNSYISTGIINMLLNWSREHRNKRRGKGVACRDEDCSRALSIRSIGIWGWMRVYFD
jgi:hypothetical protein